MTLQLTIGGCTVPAEISDEQIAVLRSAALPVELNAKDAAAFMGHSQPTFRRLKIPRNVNGFYSVKLMQDRAEQICEPFVSESHRRNRKSRQIKTRSPIGKSGAGGGTRKRKQKQQPK